MIPTLLVDQNNFDEMAPAIIREIQKASFVGIDTETQDSNRHDGLNTYCGYKEDGKKAANRKLVFDFQRTVMTGFSLYPKGGERAYYINLNHADVENRVAWEQARILIDALPPEAHFIAHNAAYELTVFKTCYDLDLPRTICTLQMAVSAFGPDEYDMSDFIANGQGSIKTLIPALLQEASKYDMQSLHNSLEELIGKITGKQSTASFSYNGFVADVAYTYGLKRLVNRFFDYQMTTFEQCLGDKAHMGQLTGQEVASYGAEDAYWAVRLFDHLLGYMVKNCPDAVATFFNQENPMVKVYANLAVEGMRVNTENIVKHRDQERIENAQLLRDLKATIKRMLPFPVAPHEGLEKRDAWYAKSWPKYRKQIEDWAKSPDFEDAFAQCYQTRGAVSNAWAIERGKPESNGPNLSHYMPARVMLYDLTGAKLIIADGKTQSDGEARGKLLERFSGDAAEMVKILTKLAGVDQRLKLFLTPYTQLMDPDTGRLYPTFSSMLATRRMAASTPNPQQLAKRGESTYVRGFFQADYEDHVLISIDWSAIELVIIGELSGDPEFHKAYGQIPHEDLHTGAAASVLAVTSEGLTEDIFKSLKKFEHKDDFVREYAGHVQNIDRLFRDVKGNDIPVEKAFKFWRNTVGKPANFGYWYSGSLFTMASAMGWTPEETQAASESYRTRFAVAEDWRKETINQVRAHGYVELPDHHRRVRLEATDFWRSVFLDKFCLPNAQNDDLAMRYNAVWQLIAARIQRRAGNQAVNAMVQGTSATLTKRSILRVEQWKREKGYTNREFRFWGAIHDELVMSVHRDIAAEVIPQIRDIMISHPDLFINCRPDASPSVGLNFEPYSPKTAPFGQIELFEAPDVDWLSKEVWGGKLDLPQTQLVIDYLQKGTTL